MFLLILHIQVLKTIADAMCLPSSKWVTDEMAERASALQTIPFIHSFG